MNHIKKSRAKILALVISVLALVAIAIWQFFLFATFADSHGFRDPQGGAYHFWLGLGATLLACVIGFFFFSAFVRYDNDKELHITS